MWLTWKNTFLNIANKHAPLKKRRVTSKRLPWITRELITKKRQKACLKNKAVLSKLETDWAAYKSAKNSYNRLIKRTIRQHYQDKLQNDAVDLKKTWKTINELMHMTKKGTKISELRTEDNETIDPSQIPNKFNKYFIELGDKLSNDIPSSATTPEDYLTDFTRPANILSHFKDILEIEILRLLQGLSVSKASGVIKFRLEF